MNGTGRYAKSPIAPLKSTRKKSIAERTSGELTNGWPRRGDFCSGWKWRAMSTENGVPEYYELQAAKRELALQCRAALLLAKIRMMQYEFFHSDADELKEAA